MRVDDTVALAQSYLDSGRPFHAHEVLEALWKTRPADERDLWQGLAQIAVGLTHAMRGNTVGATTLLRRGAGRVANYAGDTHGIDIERVLGWAGSLADVPTAEPRPLTLRAPQPS
jgi:predicted metal-dependent hydrolase